MPIKEDKVVRSVFGKGWSRKNIIIGAAFFVIGYLTILIDSFFAGSHSFLGDPGPIHFKLIDYIAWILGFLFITIGSLGFWLLIPAFQKWGKTRRRLVWVLSVIAAIIVLLLIVALNNFFASLSAYS